MAATELSVERLRLDAELENLARMLPAWREHLRHEAQFWPQFDVLTQEIIARADVADRDYARTRIEEMISEQGLVR